jgi:hypothetical protein
MKYMTQQEKILQLAKLVQENPELEILVTVDNDIHNDDYNWSIGSFGISEVDEYYVKDERIYLKSDSWEDLVEQYFNENEFPEDMSDEVALEIAEKKVNEYEWIKCVVVDIDTP